VFPIAWPEPFGLVMVEAMACGTPVIAWRNGSVPEVVDDDLTGAIVNSIDGAVAAIPRVAALSRRALRARFEARFTSERMARDYLALYRELTFTSDQREDGDARDRSGYPGLLRPGYRVARG
jgi:glycosyltransferase involved in cell wall biosynthesis